MKRLRNNIGLFVLLSAVGCAPRAYVISPVTSSYEYRTTSRFSSPTAVKESTGVPSRVPSPEDKLAKQGSKPAVERTVSSIDFMAAIDNGTEARRAVDETVTTTSSGGRESEHIKVSSYDPFGSNKSFELDLDGLEYSYPIAGRFSSGYGMRGRSMHSGIDFGAAALTPIYAVFDGVVRLSKPYSGYGNVVVLRHENGLETVYAHNTKNLVRVGQKVRRGEQIAQCGRTGRASANHLHFEVRVQGMTINPTLLLDVQGRTLQSGVLVVSRSSNGTISARLTKKTRIETPVEEQEVLAQATPATAVATAAAVDNKPEEESEPEPQTIIAVPVTANASRGIRVGDKVYKSPSTDPKSTQNAVYHTIAQGETLSAIARQYGTSWTKISKLNNWTPQQADRIKAGSRIRVK